jgi:hypothetical protein
MLHVIGKSAIAAVGLGLGLGLNVVAVSPPASAMCGNNILNPVDKACLDREANEVKKCAIGDSACLNRAMGIDPRNCNGVGNCKTSSYPNACIGLSGQDLANCAGREPPAPQPVAAPPPPTAAPPPPPSAAMETCGKLANEVSRIPTGAGLAMAAISEDLHGADPSGALLACGLGDSVAGAVSLLTGNLNGFQSNATQAEIADCEAARNLIPGVTTNLPPCAPP